MTSYASAVLNGVSADEKPVAPKPQVQAKPQQPKQQPKAQAQKPQEEKRVEAAPQQPKVYVKLEGNDGGDLGKLFRDEKDHVYTRKGDEGKKNKVVKTDRIFDIVIANVGPAGLSALGRTCKYFLNQVLKNKNLVNDLYARQKIVKPIITFKVDFVESKGDDDEGKEVKSLPLSYFADNSRRQNALCKYWARVVSQAQSGRSDPSKDISSMMGDKPFDVKLVGGFFFNGNKHGPLVAQRDLSRTLVWLDACVKLLQGRMKQELPYLEGGKVVLTRYGLGGTKIKVETLQGGKASEPKPDSPPTVHRYEFAEFCMSLRSAAKAFVPLVGTCVVAMKQGIRSVPQEETDEYLQREKILLSLLKHQQLDTAVKAVKRLLVQGAIPNSELPAMFRKRREEKLRVKQQQAVELENITKFLLSNLPDDFEEAKAQAERLNEEAKLQKEREQLERQKAFEEKQLKKAQEKAGANKKEGSEESKEEKKEVIKRKVVKEVDADGFVLEKVLLVKGGEVVGEKTTSKEESASTASSERSATSSELSSNPYMAVLQEGGFISLADEQHKKNMAKLNGRITAESKERAKAKKAKKEQAQAQAAASGKKQKGGKGGQKGGQKQAQKGQAQAKQQPKQQQAQPKQQPKQTPAPVQPKKAQPQPKKQVQKKSPKTNKPKRAQTADIPEPGDFFQPTAIALAVVGALAFGYVLVSGSF